MLIHFISYVTSTVMPNGSINSLHAQFTTYTHTSKPLRHTIGFTCIDAHTRGVLKSLPLVLFRILTDQVLQCKIEVGAYDCLKFVSGLQCSRRVGAIQQGNTSTSKPLSAGQIPDSLCHYDEQDYYSSVPMGMSLLSVVEITPYNWSLFTCSSYHTVMFSLSSTLTVLTAQT